MDNKPFIFLSMCDILHEMPDIESFFAAEVFYTEYGHIQNDPEIGSFSSFHGYKMLLSAITTHEIAHCYQMIIRQIHGDAFGNANAHQQLWQSLYRPLRRAFVNEGISSVAA